MLGNTCAAIIRGSLACWVQAALWPILPCPGPTCQDSAGHAGEEALVPARGLATLCCLQQVCECVECGGKVEMEGAHLAIRSPLLWECRAF